MAGVCVCERGCACRREGEVATEAGDTHPTRMHSCWLLIMVLLTWRECPGMPWTIGSCDLIWTLGYLVWHPTGPDWPPNSQEPISQFFFDLGHLNLILITKIVYDWLRWYQLSKLDDIPDALWRESQIWDKLYFDHCFSGTFYGRFWNFKQMTWGFTSSFYQIINYTWQIRPIMLSRSNYCKQGCQWAKKSE